jgi:Ca-activated chloride channel family protein
MSGVTYLYKTFDEFARLAEPGWLILLFLVPLPWWFQRVRPRIAWPSLVGFEGKGPNGLRRLAGLPVLLRTLVVAALAVALARPQSVGGQTLIAAHGVAIVVALDQSSSMNTADFPADQTTADSGSAPAGGPTPTGAAAMMPRLEAAKATFVRFVEGRPDDLIGLVVFANQPDLACPPTLDHRFLVEHAQAIGTARPADDGTNIGDAIVWALGALQAASPKKKVLVLLTDGRNSPARGAGAAPMEPEAAAELARDLGVTLHTIAVGKAGGILRTPEPVTGLDRTAGEVAGPDHALLEHLAQIGHGRAFAASDAAALGRVFQTIDALEKSPVRGTVRIRYREEYAAWVVVALGCLLCDRFLSAGRLRRLP